MKNISDKILNYKDEILEDVINLVRIQSVREEPCEGKPFGEDPAKALDYCINLAKNMGFKVKNVDGYAAHIEYGKGEGLVGVLSHCDVVPAGEGWTYPPFSGEIVGNRIYGRGTSDDKNAVISAIYCLKALKDLKIIPKRRIRVIIGASEECGSEDMKYYFSHEEMPDYAFTPDSEYPICNREKGILHIGFECAHDGKSIISCGSGSAPNIVPVSAEANVKMSAGELEKAASSLEEEGARFAVTKSNGSSIVRCFGKSAHASTPEDGVNAASWLVKLLHKSLGKDAGSIIRFLDEAVGLKYDGAQMGVAMSDKESGPLTLNLGILNFDKDKDSAVIDIRYPVTKNGSEILEIIKKKAEEYDVNMNVLSNAEPLYVKEDSTLVSKLKHAYETVTGQEGKTYSTGGGTYAKELANHGVAFGAGIKPLSYNNIHGADEFLEIDDFMKHCQICLQAIYELACE